MGNAIIGLIYVGFVIIMIASVWTIFVKARQPGWASIIPIYNTLIQLRIITRPWWWLLLLLVPIVNIVILFLMSIELAKSFGKGTGFGVGLFFLPFIFYPILGFGSAQYLGAGGSGAAATVEPTTAW